MSGGTAEPRDNPGLFMRGGFVRKYPHTEPCSESAQLTH